VSSNAAEPAVAHAFRSLRDLVELGAIGGNWVSRGDGARHGDHRGGFGVESELALRQYESGPVLIRESGHENRLAWLDRGEVVDEEE
jgi:hypothetical protein